jgi:hypothetical protein
MINLETPPSIEDEVALGWEPGMLAMLAVENVRRALSWPAARLRDALLRDAGSLAAGLTIADIEDIAGGALAECDGLRRRVAISPCSVC